MFDSSPPHGLQPTRLLRPWDFPGKSTGVGCHHLLKIIGLEDIKWFCLTEIFFSEYNNRTRNQKIHLFYRATFLDRRVSSSCVVNNLILTPTWQVEYDRLHSKETHLEGNASILIQLGNARSGIDFQVFLPPY